MDFETISPNRRQAVVLGDPQGDSQLPQLLAGRALEVTLPP